MAVRQNVRPEIERLAALGRMPNAGSGMHAIRQWEDQLALVQPPLTFEEAQVMLELFPTTHCHGVEWQLINLIETVPPDELEAALNETDTSNEWIETIRLRLENWKRSRVR